ncbi:DUF3888 domain-containing protein [Aminipila butyrica]|uniref:DUF3888 domain-containing protein n=1 Tax=Aminipila butyrica TaxID=433296 RepID=A0A858BTX6_9FIRM|nr:DUF3888 domain-containing protein [Aminipila butyrica]QIB68528.1 DUF3888 domain-containing protein [Aminipila butyrica]
MKRQLIVILIFLFLCGLYGYGKQACSSTWVVSKETSSLQADSKIVLINTYLNYIQEASEDFYGEYFTISPTVAYYYVWVKEISSEQSIGSITFISTPFVGPHDTVGLDEISFTADYTGKVELKEFKHIKSYPLPEHLKSLMKQPIPGEYERL